MKAKTAILKEILSLLKELVDWSQEIFKGNSK